MPFDFSKCIEDAKTGKKYCWDAKKQAIAVVKVKYIPTDECPACVIERFLPELMPAQKIAG